MNLEIINGNFQLVIFGFSGIAENRDYVKTAFPLMDKMWQVVKTSGLKNKGMNIWVYESSDKIFTGVELLDTPPP